MSLLRLLATGKSLVSLRDAESRYRLTSQRLLPQFGPTRDPFRSGGRPDLTLAGGDGLASGASKYTSEAGFHVAAKRLWLRIAGIFNSWRQQPCAVIAGSPQKATASAVVLLPKLPVQGELSLDRVKVVRNDLTDADFELASARAKTAPVSLAGRAANRAEQIWGRVSDRLFPVGKP